jgi:hypothetical protein
MKRQNCGIIRAYVKHFYCVSFSTPVQKTVMVQQGRDKETQPRWRNEEPFPVTVSDIFIKVREDGFHRPISQTGLCN